MQTLIVCGLLLGTFGLAAAQAACQSASDCSQSCSSVQQSMGADCVNGQCVCFLADCYNGCMQNCSKCGEQMQPCVAGCVVPQTTPSNIVCQGDDGAPCRNAACPSGAINACVKNACACATMSCYLGCAQVCQTCPQACVTNCVPGKAGSTSAPTTTSQAASTWTTTTAAVQGSTTTSQAASTRMTTTAAVQGSTAAQKQSRGVANGSCVGLVVSLVTLVIVLCR